jgi:hypothetical protein
MKNYKILVGKLDKVPTGRLRKNCKDNIKMEDGNGIKLY